MNFSFTEEQEMPRESVRRLMKRHAPRDVLRMHDRDETLRNDVYAAWAPPDGAESALNESAWLVIH